MSAYSFVDTIEPSSVSSMPAEAICFNGVWLDDAIEGFRTLNVQGREILSKDIETYSTGKKYGEVFRKAIYRPRTITVTYQLKASTNDMFRAFFNKLNQYLMAEEAQLIFADEPDKYFVATKESNDEIDPGANCVTGQIKFLCSDPKKYSLVEKAFTAQVDNNGFLWTRITNNGALPVPINYSIKNNDENGFIGIVTQNGVIQLGRASEADGETYKQDEVITTPSATRKIFVSDGWYVDTGPLSWSPYAATNGTLNTVSTQDTIGLKLNSPGASGGLCGGMWSHDVVDSNGDSGAVNFYAYVDCWFESGLMGQTGAQVVAFADENNNLIAAQVIYKIDESGNMAGAEFYVGDGQGGSRKVLNFPFECSYEIFNNPYTDEGGFSDIRKEGGNITFYYNSRYYSYYVPELVNAKVDKVQLFIGQYDQRGMSDPKYMTRNYFRRVGLKILGVDKYKDSINRYQAGDEIFIDGNKRKIYVNEMVRMSDEINGSNYPEANPGKTEIEFHYSDFCETPPTIIASIQEAWL